MTVQMKRRVLIIQNPGTIKEPLDGVKVDVREMRGYLHSLAGGAWENDEITILPPDTEVESIRDFFNANNRDVQYYLIYFTGHGSYSESSGSKYWLANDTVFTLDNLKDWVNDIPTLFINDCCQGVEPLNESVAERKLFSITADANEREKYRNAYNDIIRRLSKGSFCVASAASLDEEAGESSVKGGYYTSALLSQAKHLFTNPEINPGVYMITCIHSLAASQVEERTNGSQIPEISGYTRTSAPPFMVKL